MTASDTSSGNVCFRISENLQAVKTNTREIRCYILEDMKYSPSQAYSIALHSDAVADLDLLYEHNEDAAADIEAFLEEARNNQHTLDSLTRHGYVDYGDCPYNVKEWKAAKGQRLNLWRLHLLWLKGSASKYRVVYAFHPKEFRYYVLGIVHRDFDYDLRHPISHRILGAYQTLNIPGY